MEQTITKDIVVLYHGNCTDGFSAAWAAWKKFGDSADYIAMNFRSLPPDNLEGKEIYIMDYYFPEPITRKLMENNKRVTGIDHHETGEAIVKMTKDYLFDISRSGSVLVWKYFHPQEPVPKLLTHVEDMDLWKFNLPQTKEVFAYLDAVGYSFDNWEEAAKLAESREGFDKIVERGKVILKYQDSVIDAIVSTNTIEVEFEGYKALAVNCPVFISQIGAKLAEKADIGIVWVQNERGTRYSLRSKGELDVSVIVVRFPGGGGHKNAAGFLLAPGSKHPWKNKNEK